MKVCISTESLSRSNLGSITGAICLSDGNFYFPSQDWDDFPVVILGWWIETLSTPLLHGAQKECLFMDGDYAFQVSPHSADEWLIVCANRTDAHGTHQSTAIVKVTEFMSILRSAANSLVVACHNRGWNSKDIDQLSQLCI